MYHTGAVCARAVCILCCLCILYPWSVDGKLSRTLTLAFFVVINSSFSGMTVLHFRTLALAFFVDINPSISSTTFLYAPHSLFPPPNSGYVYVHDSLSALKLDLILFSLSLSFSRHASLCHTHTLALSPLPPLSSSLSLSLSALKLDLITPLLPKSLPVFHLALFIGSSFIAVSIDIIVE